MKSKLTTMGILGMLSSFALGGSVVVEPMAPAPCPTDCGGFAKARRPITNPTLFDLALPTTNLHAIFIQQSLPSKVYVPALGLVPVDGDVQVYALQFEIALNDRLSIVATKDGYVDMNPDAVVGNRNGWGNLAAGVKYAFVMNPDAGTAVSGTMTFELPTGNSDVFQGEGDGAVNLILTGLQLMDQWQFAGAIGAQIPFSDDQSTMGWMSGHVSYEVCEYFIPLVEVNWFHVIDAGNTKSGIPGLVGFEGGDYFNLGAVNASANRDFVSAAVGFRSRLSENVEVGAAYELPLTSDEKGLMDDRVTVDLLWKF